MILFYLKVVLLHSPCILKVFRSLLKGLKCSYCFKKLHKFAATSCSFYKKMTRPALKFLVHEGFMIHAECTRTALVFSFHMQVRF